MFWSSTLAASGGVGIGGGGAYNYRPQHVNYKQQLCTAVLEASTYCGSARRITCLDHDSGSLCRSTELVYAAVFAEQHAICSVHSSIGRKKAPKL